ncbi:MAG: hypothetical protein GTO30_12625, partial [Acidobacteria bacterium]|nr:hypothetical protein [Acidobacteriota bacterium]NIQ86044.1 hypothetical protein [Acidobacteriota bacterium]
WLTGCGGPDASAPRESPGEATSLSERPFIDVSAEVGLDFVNFNGMTGAKYFVEMMGSGGGFIDYDGDGDLDIYLVQGHPLPATPDSDHRDRLYRNDLEVRPDGSRTLRFTDVTAETGIVAPGYGMGITTGDYDNDGWVDLYVYNWGSNQLWHNEGDGTFADVTARSGTNDPAWSTGAAFVDFDLDGWLDLIVVNYVVYDLTTDQPCYAPTGRRDYCSPDPFPPAQDRLFRNRGDGTFEDVTLQMGFADARGKAMGVVATDFNLDGWPDIYVTNDRQENFLWMNQSGRRFTNEAVYAGAALNASGLPEASMGIVAADVDGDGDEDLFMTHLNRETNTLYVNIGDGRFEDRTRGSGLGLPSRPYTGFGIAPIDYDNDGWTDLFVANGEVQNLPEQAERDEPLPLRQKNQLFRNLGAGRFREVTPESDPLFALEEVSRGVAYGDVDNDGDADILLYNNNGPARLIRNQVGQSNPWLGLRLLGTQGRRDMLGARVEIVRPGAPTLVRRVNVAGSYCSAHDPRVLFGLDDATTIETVRVRWPGDAVETWKNLDLNRYHDLVQGQGKAAELP